MRTSDIGQAGPAGSAAGVRLRLGTCRLDLERELLLDAQGDVLPLRRRAWEVLRRLAARAGHLVGKDELIAAVWPHGAVTDDSLVQAVADIRRALGPGGHAVLRTLPRRGYLLVAEPLAGEGGTPGEGRDPLSNGRSARGEAREAPVDGVGLPAAAGCLADRLRAEAARRFVGREAELTALRPAVARALPAQALYFVHGPGGVGKSSLLERLRLMADPGVRLICVDGAELIATPRGVLDGVAAALGEREHPAAPTAPAELWAERGRSVLLIDTFEALEPVQGWMRDRWLPSLPAGVSVVLAGRRAPDSRWSAHPLWAGAMRTVALGMLEPTACARLAQAHGAPVALCERLARRARGLPLAAVLLAGEARRTGRLPDGLGEELVRALTRRCLEQAPSGAHREALLACALARRATRLLLEHLFGAGRADALFDWIAAQGYVSATRDGLHLHDLIREAVLADTGGCDRDRFRELRRTIVRYLATRLGPGRDAWDATLDFFYARRLSPGFRRFHDIEGLARVSTSLCTAGELGDVIAFARRSLTAAEHASFRRWADHPAAAVVAVRTQDGTVCAASIMLHTAALSAEDIAGDPVVAAARASLGADWCEPAGRTYSMFFRHWFAAGTTSAPNPGLTALMAYANALFADPALRLLVVWSAIPDYLAPMWPELGFRTLPECARELGGRRFDLLVRDWQAESWTAWVRRVVTPEPARAGARAAAAPPPAARRGRARTAGSGAARPRPRARPA